MICKFISFLFHWHLKLCYPIGNTAQLFFILSHVASSLISPWWDPKKLADSWWSTHHSNILSFFFLVLFDLKWFHKTLPAGCVYQNYRFKIYGLGETKFLLKPCQSKRGQSFVVIQGFCMSFLNLHQVPAAKKDMQKRSFTIIVW